MPKAPRTAKPDWSRPLATPIDVGKKRKLRTLADVREYVLSLPEERQGWSTWNHVAGTLVEAAQGGDVADVEIAFRLAKMMSS